MFTTLAFAAALSLAPAQGGGELKLANVTATYGLIGPKRTSLKFLPGDQLYLGFDIEGITLNKNSTTTYSIESRILDGSGKVWKKYDPTDRTDFVPLGGNSVPGRVFVVLGVDTEPGTYTLEATFVDKTSGAKGSLSQKIEVLKTDLGFVGMHATTDALARNPAHTTGFVGGAVWLQGSVVGFKRDPAKNQPDTKIEMVLLDEKGKPTMSEPIVHTVTALEEKYPMFAIKMNVPFTRAGKFAAKFTVTDNLAKTSASFEMPISVQPQEK